MPSGTKKQSAGLQKHTQSHENLGNMPGAPHPRRKNTLILTGHIGNYDEIRRAQVLIFNDRDFIVISPQESWISPPPRGNPPG